MGVVSRILKKYKIIKTKNLNKLKQYYPQCENIHVRDEFKHLEFSSAAMQKLIDDFDFESVLDIGAGAMMHSDFFAQKGKIVTAVDYGNSIYYQKRVINDSVEIDRIFGDFNAIEFNDQYDCVWASHILEHQLNVDMFLNKLISLVKEGGIIAITVPPFKHEIVGGHVSLWNAGLLLYRLVLCGVDCSNASILAYGYNISVIVNKKTISPEGIEYDSGDIRKIRQYLPRELTFNSNQNDDPFNGNITRINW